MSFIGNKNATINEVNVLLKTRMWNDHTVFSVRLLNGSRDVQHPCNQVKYTFISYVLRDLVGIAIVVHNL